MVSVLVGSGGAVPVRVLDSKGIKSSVGDSEPLHPTGRLDKIAAKTMTIAVRMTLCMGRNLLQAVDIFSFRPSLGVILSAVSFASIIRPTLPNDKGLMWREA